MKKILLDTTGGAMIHLEKAFRSVPFRSVPFRSAKNFHRVNIIFLILGRCMGRRDGLRMRKIISSLLILGRRDGLRIGKIISSFLILGRREACPYGSVYVYPVYAHTAYGNNAATGKKFYAHDNEFVQADLMWMLCAYGICMLL